MRVLGDAAGDLAELVPAVDFTVKKEEEGEDGSEDEEKEVEVAEAGKKLLIEMEKKAREMVDRGWEAGVAGGVIKGGVVKMAEQDSVGEVEAEGEGEGEEQFGLWEVYEAEMGSLMGKRLRMPLKERWVCTLILKAMDIYLVGVWVRLIWYYWWMADTALYLNTKNSAGLSGRPSIKASPCPPQNIGSRQKPAHKKANQHPPLPPPPLPDPPPLPPSLTTTRTSRLSVPNNPSTAPSPSVHLLTQSPAASARIVLRKWQ